jgi:hypothetical protein
VMAEFGDWHTDEGGRTDASAVSVDQDMLAEMTGDDIALEEIQSLPQERELTSEV